MKVKTMMTVAAILVATPFAQASTHTKTGTTSGAALNSSRDMNGTTTTGPTIGNSTSTNVAPVNLQAGRDFAVIEFSPGSSSISNTERTKIRQMISSIGGVDSGVIEEVHVVAWSDKAFPAGKTELKETDRNLASQRAQAIEKFLEDSLKVSDVETYSMAERANWFARAIDTNEAELKSLFSRQDAPKNVEPNEFQVVKKEGGPMKAIILIERSDDAKSTSGATSAPGSTSGAAASIDRGQDGKSVKKKENISATSQKSGAANVPSSGPLDDPKTQSDDIR